MIDCKKFIKEVVLENENIKSQLQILVEEKEIENYSSWIKKEKYSSSNKKKLGMYKNILDELFSFEEPEGDGIGAYYLTPNLTKRNIYNIRIFGLKTIEDKIQIWIASDKLDKNILMYLFVID